MNPRKGDPEKWRLARKGERCGSGRDCRPIAAGAPVRRAGVGIRCQACALNTFGEEPPDDVYALAVPQPTLPIDGALVPKGHGYVSVKPSGRGRATFTPVDDLRANAIDDIKRRASGDQE
jgi:hypothetical protein